MGELVLVAGAEPTSEKPVEDRRYTIQTVYVTSVSL